MSSADLLSSSHLRELPALYYPLFDLCHIALCVLTVRKEVGGREFAFKHPLATLVSCVISSFAGSLLANPLLGKPMFGAFKDERLLSLCFIVYVAIFFSPGDVVYTLINIKPVYISICVVKEIYRAKKIFAGLHDGSKAFPESPFFIPIVVAVIKGNGSAFMAPFARAVRGEWKLEATELMKPSVTTKECFLGAMLMLLLAGNELIYMSLVGLFLTIKLAGVLGQAVDPFAPVETIAFSTLHTLSGQN